MAIHGLVVVVAGNVVVVVVVVVVVAGGVKHPSDGMHIRRLVVVGG